VPDATPADTDSSRLPRRTSWRIRLLVALVLLLILGVGLAFTELYLQWSFAQSLYREARRRPPHPFLQVLPGGQVEHVNAQGFRGDAVELVKPANTFRIFTIGGSTTLGVSNPYQESYPYLLQTLLRERHPNVTIEVQNAGSAWYTSAHDLVAYELNVRRFAPDLVIYFEAINDLTRSFSPPWLARGAFKPDYSHYLGPYTRFTGPEVQFLGAPSEWLTVNLVRRLIHGDPDPFQHRDADNVAKMAARMTPNDNPAFKSLPSFRDYSDALVKAIQSDGHRVIVASQPFLLHAGMSDEERRMTYFAPLMCGDGQTYPSLDAMVRGMQTYNAALAEIATARSVPLADFEAAVPKTGEFFSDDVHMRKAGNERVAKAAADLIDGKGWIK